ncbi:serine/threonine-protein phosphatase 7 long form-like protein, partial [Trifolium medium]|nr:serine/threonine-protein phosphatase 7 long form-like protein [Trifolium medium]
MLDHQDIICKADGMELMVTYLSASPAATENEVTDYAVRTYLIFFVGTTIFSNKAKNYVDLTYLMYSRDLELVNMYVWGPAAMSFLYRELTNTTVHRSTYLAVYATQLQ